jgi:hypothetical protein
MMNIVRYKKLIKNKIQNKIQKGKGILDFFTRRPIGLEKNKKKYDFNNISEGNKLYTGKNWDDLEIDKINIILNNPKTYYENLTEKNALTPRAYITTVLKYIIKPIKITIEFLDLYKKLPPNYKFFRKELINFYSMCKKQEIIGYNFIIANKLLDNLLSILNNNKNYINMNFKLLTNVEWKYDKYNNLNPEYKKFKMIYHHSTEESRRRDDKDGMVKLVEEEYITVNIVNHLIDIVNLIKSHINNDNYNIIKN